MPGVVAATNETATFDTEGVRQLDRVRSTAIGNKEIADENAQALEARNQQIMAMRECMRYRTIWMQQREQELADEKREHFIDNWFHRGIILLIGIGVAAQ